MLFLRGVLLSKCTVLSGRRWNTTTPVLNSYLLRVSSFGLPPDEKQIKIVAFLDRLNKFIEERSLSALSENKETESTSTKDKSPQKRIRGLYLYGPVGVGKTMLMDLFYETCRIEMKRRVHFHQFMLDVHRSIHNHKQYLLSKYGRNRHVDLTPEHDSIRQVGYGIANETQLLCFDEFQVTDICDALILTKLFDAMWSRGVVLVATSNRPPSDLYLNGINRPDFLPFIERLQMECIVKKLDSLKDYRKLGYEEHKRQQDVVRFISPNNAENITKFRSAYEKEVEIRRNDSVHVSTNSSSEAIVDSNENNLVVIPIQGNRFFSLSKHDVALDVGVCYLDFALLCRMDRGAVDYHALCQHFQVVYLHGIPKLTRRQHDAARRFVILIDELYNHNAKLACLAEAANPQEMLANFIDPIADDDVEEDIDTVDTDQSNDRHRSQNDNDAIPKYGRNHSTPSTRSVEANTIGQQEEINVNESQLSAIKDLQFAFQRATSRIMEMISW